MGIHLRTSNDRAKSPGDTASSVAGSDAALWGRLLRPGGDDLSPEAARFFLGLSFDDDDKARMHDLAGKARAGTLTRAEQAEIETYERVGCLLGLLQAKARFALKHGGGS